MEYKRYKDKYGLVLDWETTGSEWGGDSSIEHQGISMGAAIFDTQTLLPVEKLYREIKFDPQSGLNWKGKPYKWTESAERIHGLSQEHLMIHGVTQEEAAVDLMNMMMTYFAPDQPVLFMGHNVDFDILFTRQLLEPLEIMFDIRITKLDTSCLGWMTLGLHKSDDIFDFLGLEERTEHNALEDALMTLEAARRMRMLTNSALGL